MAVVGETGEVDRVEGHRTAMLRPVTRSHAPEAVLRVRVGMDTSPCMSSEALGAHPAV